MRNKFRGLGFCVLYILFASTVNCFGLDREAFSFTKYDLDLQVDTQQQRLSARGKITLRNDSTIPQKIAVLQISSSLTWRSIKAGGKQLQFVSQPYISDIDHTGALSEAVVTLPEATAPRGTLDIEIAYEGVVALDATRLTRIGSPETAAQSNDWDRIAAKFTAVRGVGYVAWYPVATEAASLSEGTDLFEVLNRWKTREAASNMHLQVTITSDEEQERPEVLLNATACPIAHEVAHQFVADCTYRSMGYVVPTFVIADYDIIDRPAISVHFLHGHDGSAATYADAAEQVVPLITEWFGALHGKAETAELADPDAAPFESSSLLLEPLTRVDAKVAGVGAAHQLTHAAFFSARPWINEGLAHFVQALYLERRSGRQAALDYMGLHRSAFIADNSTPRKESAPRSEDQVNRSLINTADEELYRSKAMCVWWMLRDMIGEAALKKALASYHPDDDKEPSYLPRLIQAQTQRDLEWFFDDWVYRNHGLPDFKVQSAFARQTLPEGYMVTITVDNLGAAGAEVPIIVKFSGGEITKRLVVRGKSNAVIRVEVPRAPEEIVVNDGSVPERDLANNVFKIEQGDPAK